MLRKLFILGAVLSLAALAQAQTDFVTTDGVTNVFHRQNLGRIVFTEKPLTPDQITDSAILQSAKMLELSDLDIRVFMADSLTNYLHRLAPELSAAELVNKGNFQFSFFIDGALVYRENLNPGAGTPETKNKRTTIRVPLLSSSNEDSWGRFLWMRFLVRGGEEALFDASRRLRVEIRPYVDAGGMRVGEVIGAGQITIDAVAPKIDEKDIAVRKPKPANGWRVAKSGFDRSLIRELKRRIALGLYKNITGIVVIKDGKLLLEEYFGGATREMLHDTRSVGKSFVSSLTGIAIGDGFLKSEKQTLADFYDLRRFENYQPEKGNVTIERLLTMTSGFAADDNDESSAGNEEKMYPTKDWVKFALDLPMDSDSNNGWRYFTGGTILLGDIMEKRVPGGLEKYAAKRLFGPLGIERYKWQYTPQNVPNTAGGLQLRALDLARFGEVYGSGGKWNGKQIVPRAWVDKSLTRHAALPEDQFYGFLFWNKTFRVTEKPFEAFYASGNGGNKIFVFKKQRIVIVITATAFGQPYAHSQSDQIVQKFLLPATGAVKSK